MPSGRLEISFKDEIIATMKGPVVRICNGEFDEEAFEKGFAAALQQKWYSVLGSHSAAVSRDPQKIETMVSLIEARLSGTIDAALRV